MGGLLVDFLFVALCALDMHQVRSIGGWDEIYRDVLEIMEIMGSIKVNLAEHGRIAKEIEGLGGLWLIRGKGDMDQGDSRGCS